MTIHRTMIVPAAQVEFARHVASVLSGGGTGMFEVGLTDEPAPPLSLDPQTRMLAMANRPVPTHYISCGQIEPQFAALIADSAALHNAAVSVAATRQLEYTGTMQQCVDLVAEAIVSESAAHVVLNENGLRVA